ncbi:MAG: DUF4300 family protein [Lachnospiraceae bacterium]|nr:DUF4300 family protein [Lachnospiraceae bacterium]
MKKPFKTNCRKLLSAILLAGIVLTGCSQSAKIQEDETSLNPSNDSPDTSSDSQTTEYLKEITYSNLLDSQTQNEVKDALTAAGVTQKNADFFLQSVRYYNDTIDGKGLVEKGFKTSDTLEPTYDVEMIQNKWDVKNPSFIGYNCRITAFGLLKDLISVQNTDLARTEELFMDEDALQNNPDHFFTKHEESAFKSLFSSIPTESTKDISVHLKQVENAWKKMGITFSNKSKASLISVFFHSEITEDEVYLFIGHTGVLLPSQDGKLLFIEKVSFQEPYQVLKFDNRTQVNDYLMHKYDTAWGQPTAKPFILENDSLIEGYRANPDNRESN